MWLLEKKLTCFNTSDHPQSFGWHTWTERLKSFLMFAASKEAAIEVMDINCNKSYRPILFRWLLTGGGKLSVIDLLVNKVFSGFV